MHMIDSKYYAILVINRSQSYNETNSDLSKILD